MKVNYVLMYGTPYIKYREFETFEDVSKFLVNKSIVNYTIFKKLEDEEEVEMIYRDNDIKVLLKENENKEKVIKAQDNIIKEVREYIEEDIKGNYFKRYDDEIYKMCDDILEILDKVSNNEDN